jgi:hypothetical protein
MQRMSMVSPELRVGAFERWVAVGLRLFDATMEMELVIALAKGLRLMSSRREGM